MKRIVLVVSALVIVAALISCSTAEVNNPVNETSEQTATTAIVDYETDETRYYEVVNENGTTILAEIVTNSKGEPITDKTGEYVTTESTTTILSESITAIADDNEVPFDPSETSTKNNTTTENETTTPESPTDSDGWINRWY